MSSISQNDRFFSFDSPLGPDALLVNSFGGTEQMSELFEFELELVSEDFNIAWDTIIDRNVTVGVRMSDGATFRYFNGYINQFEPMRHEGHLAYYKATMVPWLWYLTQTSDHFVYQKMTVVDVIKKVFLKAGFQDYDVKSLGERHTEWIQCCQYQETGFEFISRLAEAEGIYYFFKHEKGKHTLMMVDHLSDHQPCPYQSTIKYEHQTGEGALKQDDSIFSSNMRKVIRPNKFAHKDFNFLIPSHELYYEAPMKQFMGSNRTLEQYIYPGEYEWLEDAPDWGDLRQEEFEHDRTWVEGSGNARALAPGYRFDLTDHDRPEQNINYLILKVTHHAHEGSWGAGADMGEMTYSNSFSAIPSTVQFRPGRKTERPNIASLQTGIVVGPQGEEIYTDEYGRVKVHFHWDRTKPTEDSSCWIRVMQPIAGPGFGHIWLPRVGQEVIIQFVDGDPDRPVVTGCLYNHKNHPPYPLPGNKNWSGVKTRSTLKGDASEFNELRFIDTKGDELFVLHAQKDMQISVENDTVESIDRDRTLQIKRNQTEMVAGDKHSTVKGSLSEDIQAQMSLNVKKDITEKAGGTFILQAGGDIHLKAGGRIVLEAAQGITFLGADGSSFIDVNAAGVIVQGDQVQINCGLPLPDGALDAVPTLPNLPSLADVDLSSITDVPNLTTGLGPVAGAVAGAVGDLGSVTSGLTGDLGSLTSSLSGDLSAMTSELGGGLSSLTSGLSSGLSSVTSGLGSGLSSITSGLTSDISGVAGGAGGVLSGLTSGLTSDISGVAGGVGGGLSGLTSGISSDISGVAGGAGGGLSGLTSGISSDISGVAGGAGGGLSGLTSGISSDISGVAGGAGGGLSGLTSGISSDISGVAGGAGGGLSGLTSGIGSDISGVAGGAGGGLSGLTSGISSDIGGTSGGAAGGSASGMTGGISGDIGGVAGGLASDPSPAAGDISGAPASLSSNPWVVPSSISGQDAPPRSNIGSAPGLDQSPFAPAGGPGAAPPASTSGSGATSASDPDAKEEEGF